MAEFTTLYSGSSGNCTMVREDGKYLLIDMGKSNTKTKKDILSMGLSTEDLVGVLVTHEHVDHIMGLRIFLKYNDVPVYASAKTLEYLLKKELVPHKAKLCEVGQNQIDVGGFGVNAFKTQHDSVDCHGFRVTTPAGKTAALATDLGCMTQQVFDSLCGANVVSLESNYDYDMLMSGPYPYYLKSRINSQNGHLCNDDCADTIVKLMQKGCEKFVLCHISRENNTPERALSTLKLSLLSSGARPGADCTVQAAKRQEVSPTIYF